MRFASVCSGIEAASVAWHPLGWQTAWLSEIDPFPCAVLAHHYPTTPNLGDMTKISEADLERHGNIDLLVGGTPCQSFSVAGLRRGIADERGNLALEFLRLLGRTGARWVVWENVPGVFSSLSHDAPDALPPQDPVEVESEREEVVEDEYDADESHAFGCFLAGLSELGYGWAYGVLDAQYAGLAQRRKRVFVVGYLGDWRRAAAVLSLAESVRWNPPPSREEGAGVAGSLEARASTGGYDPGAHGAASGHLQVACPDVAYAVTGGPTGGQFGTGRDAQDTFVAHAYRKSHRASSVDDHETWVDDGIANTLNAFDVGERDTHAVVQPIAFTQNQREEVRDLKNLAAAVKSPGTHAQTFVAQVGVRRLTPKECLRLQGFPDDYLDVTYRGAPASDWPKYKAIGNSMATNVMAWIGRRIAAVERMTV